MRVLRFMFFVLQSFKSMQKTLATSASLSTPTGVTQSAAVGTNWSANLIDRSKGLLQVSSLDATSLAV